MNIAIIGIAGGIGSILAKLALDAGHQVTGLARSPERLTISHENLTVLKGDVQRLESIEQLVKDNDVVVSCIGTSNVMQRTTVFSDCASNLAKTLSPDQLLISVTGLGAGDSKGHCGFVYDRIFLPVVLRRIYADKDREEAIIKDSISKWIIVRPGFLNNGARTQTYRALTDLTGIKGGQISRADVADFILKQAESPQFIGKTPMLIY